MVLRIGKVQISRAILESDIEPKDLIDAFGRYLHGDWGTADGIDDLSNDIALVNGDPVIASYRARNGQRFCITTQFGFTRVIMPHELACPQDTAVS
ncbi:MAG: hypothetical protein IRZ10_00540 [Thermoflavifilum sp.]|nr:hypothetical protein [Thermoflavifilum sp.]MCL6512874.1 hypothetical protein [Alicyclobacillus sp.]